MMVAITFVIILSSFLLAGKALDDSDVQFYLYSSKHPVTPIQYKNGMTKTAKDLIDPGSSIKILCHGYVDNSSSYWVEPTKSKYLAVGKTNVISVDWSKHAFESYTSSANQTKPIGEFIAGLVTDMSDNLGIPLHNFHLIGHSLGSHISGFTGKEVFKTKGNKIGRITGLDPAGPLFNGEDIAHHLSSEDAEFVDAIHTNALIFGYKDSLAHADFWPNGGFLQPGCGFLTSCSHIRAPIYFYESIGNQNFPAWECNSIESFNEKKCFVNKKVVMGDNCDPKVRGNFYLNTTSVSPFGKTSY